MFALIFPSFSAALFQGNAVGGGMTQTSPAQTAAMLQRQLNVPAQQTPAPGTAGEVCRPFVKGCFIPLFSAETILLYYIIVSSSWFAGLFARWIIPCLLHYLLN